MQKVRIELVLNVKKKCCFPHVEKPILNPLDFTGLNFDLGVKMRKSGKYFQIVEQIFWKYEGRSHFGKMNTLNYDGFKGIHPNWNRFIAIRNQLDPNQIMLNNYLKKIFNL